ncbi:MAG: polyketide cyclase [Cyclobacteriaceae bacterium]
MPSTIKAVSRWGLIAALALFIFLLLIGGLEGMLCVLMALPLILIAMAIGILTKYLITRNKKRKEENIPAQRAILPFVIFLALGISENQLPGGKEHIVEVRSEIELSYSPLQVYEAIKSVDTLEAEKSFLMYFDLPVPHKCVLHEEKIGGLRTCYFEGGQIVERITALEKGKLLKMDVIDYQLTGRKWLKFKEAIYEFREIEPGKTQMTRITTYSSELRPRFYWQPLEEKGIEQEHEFVFRSLENDLKAIRK